MKRLFLLSIILPFFAVTVGAGVGKIVKMPEPVPGVYIIVLDNGIARGQVPVVAEQLVAHYGGKLRLVLNNAANIFTAEMSEVQAETLSHIPYVLQVEENAVVHLSEV